MDVGVCSLRSPHPDLLLTEPKRLWFADAKARGGVDLAAAECRVGWGGV
jgi:hypothetical protein